MRQLVIIASILISSALAHAEWLVEFEIGIQLGTQTEKSKSFLSGVQAGVLFGHKWNDFSAGMEFRYLNQHAKPTESDTHKLHHTFPIGFAFRYDLPQQKLRPEFAYYYDCATYKDITFLKDEGYLLPVSYGIAWGGYGSWRAGASYLVDGFQTVGLFYERQVYKQYKVRRPRVTTGDTIPYKEWDFWSVSYGLKN